MAEEKVPKKILSNVCLSDLTCLFVCQCLHPPSLSCALSFIKCSFFLRFFLSNFLFIFNFFLYLALFRLLASLLVCSFCLFPRLFLFSL